MAADTFICGECQQAFHDLALFIQHKNVGCGAAALNQDSCETQQLIDAAGNHVFIIHESLEDPSVGVETLLKHIEDDQTEAGTLLVEDQSEQQPPPEEPPPQPSVELVPVEGVSVGQEVTEAPIDLQIVFKPAQTPGRGTGRRRGRPRKSETMARRQQVEPQPPVTSAPTPQRDADGMYRCGKCKKAFGKERHFVTHRCTAQSDYVDLSRGDPDLDLSGEEQSEADTEVEFKPTNPLPVKRGRGRPRGSRSLNATSTHDPEFVAPESASMKTQEVPEQPDIGEENTDTAPTVPSLLSLATQAAQNAMTSSNPALIQALNTGQNTQILLQTDTPVVNLENGETSTVKLILTTPESTEPKTDEVPIFIEENDKLQFEESVSVDFTKDVAHLFNMHVIEQNVNELAPPPNSRSNSELTVFSCNVCEKVFMTLSQVRLHCLIHTDVRPFKCFKCDYSSNSKGNLYTHMRKHTGQLFACSLCKFKSANRTHMKEHEATHEKGRKHKCNLCNRGYKTAKSLVNHVRKYHNRSKVGVAYLQELQGKHKKGVALIHQCHICNRKFKKKSDCDKHLIAHDSVDSYECKFCGYKATEREDFTRHILQNHPVVYQCVLCQEDFPSCLRLTEHVKTNHSTEEIADLEQLLEQCITQCSFYVANSDGLPQGFMPNDLNDQNIEDEPKTVTETEDLTKEEVETQDEEMKPVLPLQLKVAAGTDSFTAAGYQLMTMDVFAQLREASGNEECEMCGRLYFTASELQEHVATHKAEKPGQKLSTASSSSVGSRRFQYVCSQCQRTFYSMSTFSMHMMTAHGEAKAGPSNTQIIQCPLCDKTCDSIKQVKVHLQMSHSGLPAEEIKKYLAPHVKTSTTLGRKLYKCPYCDKSDFRGTTDLQSHMWIHQNVKPYRCPVASCSYACRSKSNLSTHMVRHSANKPFTCPVCKKAYKSRTALRWHIRSHKDGKLFKCSKCSYSATQKSHLLRHQETHNVIKRYHCEHCSYSANTVGYLKIHYTRHHKGSFYQHHSQHRLNTMAPDTKVFFCPSCDYMFGNISDLKRHLRARHQINDVNLVVLESETSVSSLVSADTATTDDIPQTMTLTTEQQELTVSSQPLQYPVKSNNKSLEKNPDIYQQLVDFQEVSVTMSGDDVVAIDNLDRDPEETIIVQPNHEVILTSGETMVSEQQYVIQYVTPDSSTSVTEVAVPSSIAEQTQTILAESSHDNVSSQEIVTSIVDVDEMKGEKVMVQETPGLTDVGEMQLILQDNR